MTGARKRGYVICLRGLARASPGTGRHRGFLITDGDEAMAERKAKSERRPYERAHVGFFFSWESVIVGYFGHQGRRPTGRRLRCEVGLNR